MIDYLSGYSSDDEYSSDSSDHNIHPQKYNIERKTFKDTSSQGSSKENHATINLEHSNAMINFTKYGSVHSTIEKLSSDSSSVVESKNIQSSTGLKTVTIYKNSEWDKQNFRKRDNFKSKKKKTVKELQITQRLKRAVEKIQNLAQEQRDEKVPDDSDEIIHIRLHTSYNDNEPAIPNEIWKTFIALLIMCLNMVINLTALALVHEYVPDNDIYEPLPDIIVSNVPAQDWGLDVSEYMIIATLISTVCVLIFHKYRFVVFRRFFLITALLYLMRAITMSVTVLPVSSRTYNCSAKLNNTDFIIIATRVANLISGIGLSVNGKHIYCGDYVFSGHTVILVMCWLFMSEYTPKSYFVVHFIYGVVALVGIIMLLIAHGHYTLDVLIGYFITTRVFWMYHTMANNPSLKKSHQYNYLSRTWCFRVFLYFEENVLMPLPCQFDWPKGFRR